MKDILILIGILYVHVSCYSQNTLVYSSPNSVGLDSLYIHSKVDSIMHWGIAKQAFPGAQLLVVKEAKIIFHQAYGYHTYDSITKVQLHDIYDLASVTKIIGPLPALMRLVDEGKLDLDEPLSTYWKPWRKIKAKKDLSLREILSHQAGLEPYIVFLKDVMRDGELHPRFIKRKKKSGYQLQAYQNIYVRNNFYKRVNRAINKSKVKKDRKYVYSGLSFLLFPQLIEQLSGQSYEGYLQDKFYAPLGAKTLGFNPSLKNYPNAIVPTEKDTFFRKTLTKGWVHDENAALLGGVSGNAGLFGTAKDLAIIMQCYVQNGNYAGIQYFSKETIEEFRKIQYPNNANRRGLGFDKPLIDNATKPLEEAYPAPLASPESFGHAGFTGTFVWADPKNQLVFIFLSNRVYPSRSHRNLYKLQIRQRLHQLFY